MCTGVTTIKDLTSVVFLNFGVEPQSAVGNIQDLRKDYSKMKKSWHTTILNLILSQTTNFRPFQLKEFADDNFKFYDNGRKFSR